MDGKLLFILFIYFYLVEISIKEKRELVLIQNNLQMMTFKCITIVFVSAYEKYAGYFSPVNV